MARRTATLSAFVIAAAAVMLSLHGVAAQPTTNNTRFDGYTYVSNVIGYVNMTMDYCDIQALVAAGNFTAALDIYTTGKNSFSGLSRRTFYRFATFAPAAGVVEPLHDALAMGRNATWLDALIKDAFAKRNGTLALGLIQVAALKYLLHEVDEGYTKTATYLNDTINNAILISDASGAPHNVDEAFALWAGGSPRACATLSGWATRLGTDLETTYVGSTYLNNAMTLALNEILASSRSANLPSYNSTRFMVQRYITLMGLQGALHSAYRAHEAVACKRPTAQVADAKATIAVHWTYLQPLLVAQRVPAAQIQSLQQALSANNVIYSTTLTAVRAVVASLGRRMSEVGSPKVEAATTAGWSASCSAAIIPARRR